MYVIIGANGFLGSYIIKTVIEKTEEQVLAVCRNTGEAFLHHERLTWVAGNVECPEEVDHLISLMKASESPCKVAYLAAIHNPDTVAKDPRRAWHTNITCLSAFLEKMENVSCLFYPSTDTVYGEGGDGVHFSEDATPAPVNIYGIQKATAEAVVRGFGCSVVRFPFLIAPSLLNHKKHFYDTIVETLKAGKPMEMFVDSKRSSLDFGTAASLLVCVMERYSADMPKTLNLSGDEDLSKYDVGLMIARKHGLDPSLVIPVSSDASDIFKTKRAKSTLLDNTRVKQLLGLESITIRI